MNWFLHDKDLHNERVKPFGKYIKSLIISRETFRLLMQTGLMLAKTLKLCFMFLCNVFKSIQIGHSFKFGPEHLLKLNMATEVYLLNFTAATIFTWMFCCQTWQFSWYKQSENEHLFLAKQQVLPC